MALLNKLLVATRLIESSLRPTCFLLFREGFGLGDSFRCQIQLFLHTPPWAFGLGIFDQEGRQEAPEAVFIRLRSVWNLRRSRSLGLIRTLSATSRPVAGSAAR